MRRWGIVVGALMCLLGASGAQAQCSGFTDVALGGFCNNVTWIKNRQITAGCTATEYCPNNSVTRLQMAAFMNRLGNVLVPTFVEAEQSGASLSINPSPGYVCETATLPAVAYVRKLQSNVALSFDVTGTQEVVIGLAKSTDGGAYVPLFATNTKGSTGQRLHHHSAVPAADTLAAGSTYRFAVVASRTGTNFNGIGAWSCQLQAVLYTE